MIATDLRQKVYELMQEAKVRKRLSIIWWRVTATSSLRSAVNAADRAAVGAASSGYCIGGWVIYARSRRRVRVVPEGFQNKACRKVSVPDMLFICRYCGGVNCGWRQLLPDWQLSAVKIWQQATAQAPALLDRALVRKPIRSTKKRCRALRWGCVSTAKKSGRYRRLDYVGPRWQALGNASIATDAYATAYRLDRKTAMLHWDTLKR